MYTFSISVLVQALLIISMSAAADHGELNSGSQDTSQGILPPACLEIRFNEKTSADSEIVEAFTERVFFYRLLSPGP